MIKNLYIENVAVAKKLNIDFYNGFSVLTGETGAGKSIIIDCLDILCGLKTSKDMIRSGEEKATVCGIFSDLDSHINELKSLDIDVDENGELTIQRVFGIDGKGNVKINGRTMPQSVLKEIAPFIMSINSQHDSQLLLDKIQLLKMIDTYSNLESKLDSYKEVYEKLTKKSQEIEDLKASIKDKAMMIDILKYQISEIETAKLNAIDEEEKLEKLKVKLKSIEQITKHASFVHKVLSDAEKSDVCHLLQRAAQSIRQLSGAMDDAEELADKLDNYRYEIDDISERVNDLLSDDDMDNPDTKLDQIEKRLAQITKLKRKYGDNIETIIKFKDDAKVKLSNLEAGDMRISELQKEYDSINNEAKNIALVLSETRHKAAQDMSSKVISNLLFLDMPKVKFIIDLKVNKNEDSSYKLGPYGFDDCDFLISANPGEPPQSISKVASGGELSRVMLSIKSVMSQSVGASTIIFDEIDSGVSGATSEKIGLKLQEISKNSQVICVTHSPQIAAIADVHYKISKSVINERSESKVEELDLEGRISELSRIIGGVDITDKQIEAAKEMIYSKYKN